MLILVRHGAAGEASRDIDRTLTSLGRSEVEALLRTLESHGLRADRIWHSRLTRAKETAGILASLSSSPPQSHDAIAPDDDPDIVLAELEDLGGTTMIVSHLPFLPHLCEELLEDVSATPTFRTATAACLESIDGTRGRGSWRLAWFVNGRDRMLRRE